MVTRNRDGFQNAPGQRRRQGGSGSAAQPFFGRLDATEEQGEPPKYKISRLYISPFRRGHAWRLPRCLVLQIDVRSVEYRL